MHHWGSIENCARQPAEHRLRRWPYESCGVGMLRINPFMAPPPVPMESVDALLRPRAGRPERQNSTGEIRRCSRFAESMCRRIVWTSWAVGAAMLLGTRRGRLGRPASRSRRSVSLWYGEPQWYMRLRNMASRSQCPVCTIGAQSRIALDSRRSTVCGGGRMSRAVWARSESTRSWRRRRYRWKASTRFFGREPAGQNPRTRPAR
jgi:hypothetical protein